MKRIKQRVLPLLLAMMMIIGLVPMKTEAAGPVSYQNLLGYDISQGADRKILVSATTLLQDPFAILSGASMTGYSVYYAKQPNEVYPGASYTLATDSTLPNETVYTVVDVQLDDGRHVYYGYVNADNNSITGKESIAGQFGNGIPGDISIFNATPKVTWKDAAAGGTVIVNDTALNTGSPWTTKPYGTNFVVEIKPDQGYQTKNIEFKSANGVTLSPPQDPSTGKYTVNVGNNDFYVYASFEAVQPTTYNVQVTAPADSGLIIEGNNGVQNGVALNTPIQNIDVTLESGYELSANYISDLNTKLNGTGLSATTTATGFTISGKLQNNVNITLDPATLKKSNAPAPTVTTTKTTTSVTAVVQPDESATYGELQYSWDNGATWVTTNTKSDFQPGADYKVLVRYAGNATYNASPNSVASGKTLQSAAQAKAYFDNLKPKNLSTNYKSEDFTVKEVSLSTFKNWSWTPATQSLAPAKGVTEAPYTVSDLNVTYKLTEEEKNTFDFTGIQGYTYDAKAGTLTTTVEVTVNKSENPTKIVAPVIAEVNASSMKLKELAAGQTYTIMGGKITTPQEVKNTLIEGLDANTKYTITTTLSGEGFYKDQTADAADTTLSILTGKVTSYDLPATVTITDETGKSYEVVTDEEGNYEIDIPAGKYTVTAVGEEGLQAIGEELAVKVIGTATQDIELVDTDKGTAKKFIDEKLVDEGNKVITGITKDTVEIVIDSEDEYNKLTDEVKKQIDELLKPGKTYPELLAEAKKFVDEGSDKFIGTHLTKDDKSIVTSVGPDTIDMIIGGEDDWNDLTESEKEAVNKKLIDEGGDKTYPELLAEAKKLVDESSDKFIKEYVSDKNGKIYTEATSENIDQILSGKDEWNKKTQAEKDAINAKLLKEKGGKTYEQLIAEAEKLIKDTTDSFIKKYVSDKDGNIYKTATKDNYKQILSGKDTWDKLSQAEKDAINKKLLNNGGKTYEELLKLAEEMAKKVEADKKAEAAKKAEAEKKAVKTGDTTNTGVYMGTALLSVLLIAFVVLFRRKRMR